MLELSIMIEGQDGLNWKRWFKIAETVEQSGFSGLYRSDHYTNASPPDKDSLELWVSLTWLASHTSKIQFGPLVSPVSFRHPTMTARMAAAVDDLSNGRLILGLGAGWQEREHHNYGWELLSIPERFKRFEEGLEVITRLLRSDEPSSFSGKFYFLEDAILLPRPSRKGGPPILIGGNGIKRTLPLVARYAQEWNAVYLPADEIKKRNEVLDQLLIKNNRAPNDVKRSLMTGCIYAETKKELAQKVSARTKGKLNAADLIKRGLVVGTPDDMIPQLEKIKASGIEQVMLQWLNQDDLAGLTSIGKYVLPHIIS